MSPLELSDHDYDREYATSKLNTALDFLDFWRGTLSHIAPRIPLACGLVPDMRYQELTAVSGHLGNAGRNYP